MRLHGVRQSSIVAAQDRGSIEILDQRALPHAVVFARLTSLADVARAIRQMWVRGAPLIGAVAAYGVCLAIRESAEDSMLDEACRTLAATRPTAVNLRWALAEMRRAILEAPLSRRFDAGWSRAVAIADEDVAINEAIGRHGLGLLRELYAKKVGPGPLNVLTHCNPGAIATLDWGTALAPLYMANDAGLPVHVWVSETRPRMQGALTAWELGEYGVPHTVVVDSAAGHILQRGMVDVCMVGTDRVTARGDVCNKIGTYLKAVAARDCGIPFFVALPYPTIDWTVDDGIAGIPIEERDAGEVLSVHGEETTRLYPEATRASNYAFDVTPARLVTGLITERGIASASREGLLSLYPERAEVRRV